MKAAFKKMSAVHRSRFFFFFQAEDGIRDDLVTGVQTCALPIYGPQQSFRDFLVEGRGSFAGDHDGSRAGEEGGSVRQGSTVQAAFEANSDAPTMEIGRASCRERV